MADELNIATNILRNSLENHMFTCSTAQKFLQNTENIGQLQAFKTCLDDSLELLASYQTKLYRLKAALNSSRNSLPEVVPISTLPCEIMTRIFHLVLSAQPDVFATPPGEFPGFPKYPDILTHVCSRWRQIAIASSTLWSHIQFAYRHPLSPGFLARAKTYVARAGETPLDICFVGPRNNISDKMPEDEYSSDFEFLPSTTSISIKSLNLEFTEVKQKFNPYFDVLQYFLEHCAPGTLEKLVVHVPLNDPFVVSVKSKFTTYTSYNPRYAYYGWVRLDLFEKDLEDQWYSISVLQLEGMRPYWTSKAYHGLVDLRIGCQGYSITEAQFIDILKASPELQILHFGPGIVDRLLPNSPGIPVQLNDLKELNFKSSNPSIGSFFRCIAPGQTPLKLSIFGTPTHEVEKFFARSNIIELRMAGWEGYSPANLFRLCPRLRILALDDRAKKVTNFRIAPDVGESGTPILSLQIDTLYLIKYLIDPVEFVQMLKSHSVQRLIAWHCKISRRLTHKETQEIYKSANKLTTNRTWKGGLPEDWPWTTEPLTQVQ